MARISVVLPAPFGPSSPSSSPSPSANDNPSSARVEPKLLRASLISSTAMLVLLKGLPPRAVSGPAWPPISPEDYPVTTTYGETGTGRTHFLRDERSGPADDRRRIACRGYGPTLTSRAFADSAPA